MSDPTLKLTDSATRAKRDFFPANPERVTMYVCGPTVYDRAHLGNARAAVTFDVLYRVLMHLYGADAVHYARNLTDVEDKINARAVETGRAIGEITEETIAWYHEDMAALGVLPPRYEPRATGHIPGMVAMIETLVAKGHAYAAEGHVLFAVRSFDGYGAFSGRSVDDMIAGARVEVAPYKRDPMDFVLWKPSEGDEPGWESPWGRGRPGWHIECSAMAAALLGETVDIHGGGGDLRFPHHENEIAQSVCAHDGAPLARYWVHNEMLRVEGAKMSKSLGNFFTVRDLLDRGVPGEAMRLVLLGTHYAKPLDWTQARVEEARTTLSGWRDLLARHGFAPDLIAALKASGEWRADPEFVATLANDLNTPGAIARLHGLAKGRTPAALAPLAWGLEMLGLVTDWIAEESDLPDWVDGVVTRLLAARAEARAAKDWAEADRVRDVLTAAGVQVADVGGAATWTAGPGFDPAALEGHR